MWPDWLLPAVLFFGFLAVVLGPLFILLLPDLGRHRALTDMLQRLALKGVGRLDEVADGPVPVPRLTAKAGERELAIGPDVPNEDEHPGSLLFRVAGPLALPRLEVRPRAGAGAPPRGLPGLVPAPLTDVLLARSYEALAEDTAWWTAHAPRLERALERLATLGEKPAFALSVNRARVEVRRLNGPKEDGELEALVIRIAELVDGVLAAATGAPPAEGPCCFACGAALARIETRCRRCRTAYHDACWKAAGGCALYPCSCTTAIDPDVEALVLPAPQG